MPTCATARPPWPCTSCDDCCEERAPISDTRGGGEPEAPPRRARLFVALDPDTATRSTIAAWRDEALAGREELRLPGADSLHVTLAFLGQRPVGSIPELARVALGAVEGLTAPVLHPRELVGVPPRRPRLLALDLVDSEWLAAEVQGRVVDALAATGMHEPEKRPFWPHLTLARVRGAPRHPAVEPPSGAGLHPRPLVFDSVALYRSHLGPRGARYEALERRRLVRPG